MRSEKKSSLPETLSNNYRSVRARHSVSPKAAPWYVKRAKHFVWERDLAGLKALSAGSVSAYFVRALSRLTMEEWQIGPMVDGVRILCEEVVALPWAAECPWGRW